jgi:hypothetical protein
MTNVILPGAPEGEVGVVRKVAGDSLELPRGALFYVWPAPVRDGDLVVFKVGDKGSIGRWRPNREGGDWIVQQKRNTVIVCVGPTPVRILGHVIPCEAPPKQITDLPESEYGHLFKNPFPRWLECN